MKTTSLALPGERPIPTTPRWRFLRAGIQNVWEYDDARFVFHHGRLLLHGQNEAGKTKALELLLPFLLDASLQPHRLDPFGSDSRPMRWNLLNEGNADTQIAIGYVWLELGRLEGTAPQYCTIGAGLRAKRSTPAVDDWYFITGLRPDADISFLGEGRVPLTRGALEDLLADRGEVYDSAGTYREALNARLFGLSGDQYSALVDALLQLRRPQLSKKLDPDGLSELLGKSLPPLDATVVGTLAEGFERLDRHRRERDESAATLEGVKGFLKIYRGYVASFARARARQLTGADSAFHSARGARREAEQQKERAHARQVELADTIASLERDHQALGERLTTLRSSEEYRAIEQLDRADRDARAHADAAGRLAKAAGEAHEAVSDAGRKLAAASRESIQRSDELERARGDARRCATGAALEPTQQVVEAAPEQGRAVLDAAVEIRNKGIALLEERTLEVNAARERAGLATQRLADADARRVEAREKLETAERERARAREHFAAAVERWSSGVVQLRGALPCFEAVTAAEQRGLVEAAAQPVRTALEARAAAAGLALAEVDKELSGTEAERHQVASRTDRPPDAPAWRSARPADRPGAPLYLLCDYRASVSPEAQAGLEAALEASGLLDAWVTPDGRLLDPATHDALLSAAPIRSGRTALEVLEPLSAGGVPVKAARSALASIGLRDRAPATTGGDAACWVSTGGQFQIGPLVGASARAAPAFIGATARELARRRTLAELDAKLGALRDLRGARLASMAAIQADREALSKEVACFPDPTPVIRAGLAVSGRAEDHERACAVRAEAAESLRRAEDAVAKALAARDAEADRLELRGWVDRLDELRKRTADYRLAARELLSAWSVQQRAAADLEERKTARADAERRADGARRGAEESRAVADVARAHAEALRLALGSTRDELLTELKSGEEEREEVAGQLKQAREDLRRADEAAGIARQAFETAERDVAGADEARKTAEAGWRQASARGVLGLADLAPLAEQFGPVESWSYTDALHAARRADEATVKVDPSTEARDRMFKNVAERHQELQRTLRADIRVLAEQAEGLMLYRASMSSRSLGMLELVAQLEADIASREHLLGTEEQALFDDFLTGETHEHLRGRIREAHALVRRMNRLLEAHPTSSGMQMRLGWEVRADAPTGTRRSVDLLLRSGQMLSDADRQALTVFLKQQLDQARRMERDRPLRDQMMVVLDYRRWHQFQVDYRTATEGWKRLTRKAHAAGSGGQKAVMLHLPLFAAASAFYESAVETAPRLILLDEAFAGIDRETRGQLMGLLAEFGLDFVMTSYEEWGFYPQLDGLSTYHLSREKGMRGVFADWFVWNGREAVHVEQR